MCFGSVKHKFPIVTPATAKADPEIARNAPSGGGNTNSPNKKSDYQMERWSTKGV